MPRLIQATAIYDGVSAQVLYDLPVVTINADDISAYSPRPVVIKRRIAPGSQGVNVNATLTFDICDPEIDSNSLWGVAVTQHGKTIVLDVLSVEALIEAANACCDDETGVLPGFYTSGIAQIADLTLVKWEIVREDDGTPFAFQQVSLDYLGQYIGGTLYHGGYNPSTGESTYYFSTSPDFTVVAVGGDTVALD